MTRTAFGPWWFSLSSVLPIKCLWGELKLNSTEMWHRVGEVDGVQADGVAGLAVDPAWQLSVLTGGRWSVAERSFQHGGHQWVVGLTPAQAAVALIVWRDDQVVAHARGDEAEMCAAALAWVAKILVEPSNSDRAKTVT
jgi:hypothetical protein